jgi:hypothetical protein
MLRRAARRNYIEVYWPINFKRIRAHEPLTAGQINHLLLFPTQRAEQRPAPVFIIARQYLHKTP